MPIDAIRERVREAVAKGAPLRIRGGGSKDFYGNELRGDTLDTRMYTGIVSYEPTELVVTARCGTPLAEIEQALAANGQMLAFEPPRFAHPDAPGGTLGGCVAAGLSGPRRWSAGAVRDYVLGVKLLDGRARVLAFGGEVMKNVAGYDVSRLLAGSLGTLGVLLEVSLKVLPRPAMERTLRLEYPEASAIETLNQWGGRPLPVSASAWHDGVLNVRLSGAQAAIQAATEKIGGDTVGEAEADAFWAGMRDHTDPYFSGEAPLWRLALPSTATPAGLAGPQLIEWGGAQRWLRTNAEARIIRETASRSGGHATLFRAPDKNTAAFTPPGTLQMRLHRGLKKAFDPAGIFNPGRLYPDF